MPAPGQRSAARRDSRVSVRMSDAGIARIDARAARATERGEGGVHSKTKEPKEFDRSLMVRRMMAFADRFMPEEWTESWEEVDRPKRDGPRRR